MKLSRRPPATVATAVLLLLSLLLAVRAHMETARTERRDWLASRELPLPRGGALLATLYRQARAGPHVPGWAVGLLPGLFLVCLLARSDRVAGRSLATTAVVLAGAAATRPAWRSGAAYPEALFPLALIPFLPRDGPGVRLAPLAVILLAAGLGEAPHLGALVLGAEALAVPGRRRALAPAILLALALHAWIHPAGRPGPASLGLPGWCPPEDPLAWGWIAAALTLSLRGHGPPSERARRGALALHTAAWSGSLPLLVLETLPRLGRLASRAAARARPGPPGPRAAALALGGALVLAPLASRLGPRGPTRGLLLPPRLGPRLRIALRQLSAEGHRSLRCPPPYRPEAAALSGLPILPPLWPQPEAAPPTAALAPPGAPPEVPPGWHLAVPSGRGPGLMRKGRRSGTVPPVQEGDAHGS